MKLCTLILAAIPQYAYPGKAYPVGKGCENLASGDTYNCHCKTGQDDMDDDTIVFNQCKLGKERGATHGEAVVDLQGNMGLAVYSGKSTSICGGSERRCKCTCFNEDAVSGSTSTPFQTSTSTKKKIGVTYPGYETYCLGLCGENCNAGFDGPRYASILIHDVCQSYIRSDKPMPNTNDCSDEGYHAAGAAALTTGLGYNCLA
jgi:hypothetical protein